MEEIFPLGIPGAISWFDAVSISVEHVLDAKSDMHLVNELY